MNIKGENLSEQFEDIKIVDERTITNVEGESIAKRFEGKEVPEKYYDELGICEPTEQFPSEDEMYEKAREILDKKVQFLLDLHGVDDIKCINLASSLDFWLEGEMELYRWLKDWHKLRNKDNDTPQEIPVQYYNDDNKKIVLTLYYADYENARIKFIYQCKQSNAFLSTTPSELTNKFYDRKWLEHLKVEIAVKDVIEIKQYTDYTQVITKNNYADNKGTLLLVCETKEEIEKLCE